VSLTLPKAGRRAVLAAAALALAAPARAQDWPSQPIRIVVTFPPGGSTDIIARVLSPEIERRLGRPLVVENRAGAGGNIGMDLVAKAAPDGHTIGIGAAGALAVNPSLYPSMPFDPIRDLAAVTMVAEIPFVLVGAPRLSAATMPEVLALARSRPDFLTVAHGGNGTAMHLSAELLNLLGGVRLTPVPYRGSGPSVTAVVSGDTPLAVLDLPSSLALIRDGRLRALAVTSAARLPVLPDTPTLAEAGVAGYESVGWFGLVAPARTPEPVLRRLNEAFVAALREPAVAERIRTIGAEPRPGTPEEFAAFIRSETRKWAEVVRASGAKPD
jgi:tripartite-type tricarboxylate transporter receptor subunit TctC